MSSERPTNVDVEAAKGVIGQMQNEILEFDRILKVANGDMGKLFEKWQNSESGDSFRVLHEQWEDRYNRLLKIMSDAGVQLNADINSLMEADSASKVGS